jgi:hypothetical protein
MDIEFHYYMTYLIAARAGLAPADALIVAHAAQSVDDNHIPIEVSANTPYAYQGTLSQTMDILRPKHAARIYPIFHFIPGDPDAPSAKRQDGARDAWVTTPNSALAGEMLDTALRSKDLYRIGASTHAYVDTWAHQNFTGRDDAFNEIPGRLADDLAILRIGHALAGHQPDIPDLVWTDPRLAEPTVVNADRFLDAAQHLFRKLRAWKRGGAADPDVEKEAASLAADLKADIGTPSETSAPREARIARYKARARTPPYGATPLPDYVLGQWSDAAFVEQRSDIATRFEAFVSGLGIAGDVLSFGAHMQCTWKDPQRFPETDWFKFQEAVKAHLEECWEVLVKRFPELRATNVVIPG